MKYVASIAVPLILAVWTATAALAAGPSYRIEVAGLACPFCAYGIEKKLLALDGVETVETELKDGVVVVAMREGAALDEATAKQAVEAAGFTLEAFEPIEGRRE